MTQPILHKHILLKYLPVFFSSLSSLCSLPPCLSLPVCSIAWVLQLTACSPFRNALIPKYCRLFKDNNCSNTSVTFALSSTHQYKGVVCLELFILVQYNSISNLKKKKNEHSHINRINYWPKYKNNNKVKYNKNCVSILRSTKYVSGNIPEMTWQRNQKGTRLQKEPVLFLSCTIRTVVRLEWSYY